MRTYQIKIEWIGSTGLNSTINESSFTFALMFFGLITSGVIGQFEEILKAVVLRGLCAWNH